MALPKALTGFTSPILQNALNTGARGEETKSTNYGVIGDAFFKKAQLELNVANLQADMGIKKAELLGGLEMQRANLELQKGEIMMNAQMKAYELRKAAEEAKSDPTETLLGTLQGAVTGAAAGFSVGGPKGALIGGALGGGMALMGHTQGGDKGGAQALQTVGIVSNAAVLMKGMSDTKKKEDGFKEVMGGINDAAGAMASAQNKQDFDAAAAVYQQRMQGASAGLAKAGYTPSEIADFNTNMTASQKGIYSLDPKEYNQGYINKMGELMKKDKVINSNPDPFMQQKRAQEYLGGASSAMDQLNNYDPTKRMTKDHAISFGTAHGQQQVVQDMFNPKAPVVRTNIGHVQPKNTAGPRMPQVQQEQTLNPAKTQEQTPIVQQDQSRLTSINVAPTGRTTGQFGDSGIPFAPGIEMDDGINDLFQTQMQPVVAEQKLAETAKDTVDTLNSSKGQKQDPLARPGEPVGKVTPDGSTQKVDKFAAKAEQRVSQIKGAKQQEVARTAYESTDSLEILDKVGFNEMDFPATEAGENKKNKVIATADSAAQINTIKIQAKQVEDDVRTALKEDGVPEHKLDEEVRNFYLGLDMYDQGNGSKTEDLAMKGRGAGFSLAAEVGPVKAQGGAQGQKFDKNRALQLEGRGDKSFMKTIRADLKQSILDNYNGMVTNMDTFAVRAASSEMKGTLSNTDIALYQIKNPGDLSYNTLSSKLAEHQTKIVNRLVIDSGGKTAVQSKAEALDFERQKQSIKNQGSIQTHQINKAYDQQLKVAVPWEQEIQGPR